MPTTSTIRVATIVACPVAASSIVSVRWQHVRVLRRRPAGEDRGDRERRHDPGRRVAPRRTNSTMAPIPASTDSTTIGRARPVSPSNSSGASARRTKIPASADDTGDHARSPAPAAGTARPGRRRPRAARRRTGRPPRGRRTPGRRARRRGSTVGFTQLVITSPARSPAGTRPDATPPTTAPRKNGVTSEDNANAAPKNRRMPRRGDALAERERRAAGDHAERGQRERDVERRCHRGERRREAGPQHHEHEDQPDVVGLPDRADRVLDQRRAGGAPRRVPPASRSQMPAPKSAPREQRVRDEPDEHDGQHRLGAALIAPPSRRPGRAPAARGAGRASRPAGAARTPSATVSTT